MTCLKPREELVAESEADPHYPLPGLSTEIMPFLLTVDECEKALDEADYHSVMVQAHA